MEKQYISIIIILWNQNLVPDNYNIKIINEKLKNIIR